MQKMLWRKIGVETDLSNLSLGDKNMECTLEKTVI